MKALAPIVALTSAVLLTSALPAQRVRTLATTSSAGAFPVTAHRQVAWSSGGVVYLWDGTTVASADPSANNIEEVGFVGSKRVFLLAQGGPLYGYNVWNLNAMPYWTRLLTNPIDNFHTDGNVAVFPLPGYAGFGTYSGGTSYSSFPAGSGTTARPQIEGRYVAFQRRASATAADWAVYRYDRSTSATLDVSGSSGGGTDARIDEAGRVAFIAGASTTYARAWFNDMVGTPRYVVDIGYGAMANRYGTHLGQLVYARRQTFNGVPFELVQEEGASSRVIDTSVTGYAELQVRDGMVAWVENGLRLHDGLVTTTISSAQSGLPRGGSMLDRGWAVYGGSGGPVMLRESALTWEQSTLSTGAGGSVQLNLIAGAANAGRRYLVLMSLSGSFPGISYAGYTVPLNYDAMVTASAGLANSSMFVNTAGALDASGNATASFVLPPGLANGLAGRCLTFAYLLLTPSFSFVSNPARVKLVP